MVRENEISKKVKGGQAYVQVVAGTKDLETLRRIGRECVAHFLREQKAAYCKVFGTELDYDARDPRGVGSSSCWFWFGGIPLNGGDMQVDETAGWVYISDRCPGKLFR